MTYLGKSKNGTEMYINKLVPDIGNVLVIGSVEPHYFAGYTGGRKSFLPGVASYKTIEMNHVLIPAILPNLSFIPRTTILLSNNLMVLLNIYMVLSKTFGGKT